MYGKIILVYLYTILWPLLEGVSKKDMLTCHAKNKVNLRNLGPSYKIGLWGVINTPSSGMSRL